MVRDTEAGKNKFEIEFSTAARKPSKYELGRKKRVFLAILLVKTLPVSYEPQYPSLLSFTNTDDLVLDTTWKKYRKTIYTINDVICTLFPFTSFYYLIVI